MTDLRKAAEMALTALDALYVNDYSGYEISKHESYIVDDAIQALRQALAQPEKEFVGACVTCGAPKGEWLVDAVNMSQERVDETVKGGQEYVIDCPRCGHCCPNVDAVNISQERVDETAKCEQEPVAFVTGYFGGHLTISCFDPALVLPDGLTLYTAPPKRKWVGLSDEEIIDHFQTDVDTGSLLSFADGARYAEAKLKEKNT